MKRSDHVKYLVERGFTASDADLAAKLAQESGAEWDPEEPELPEEIYPANLYDVGAYALRREAARRFNAWGKLRKWLEEEGRRGNWPTMAANTLHQLDSLLREEG